MVAEALGRGGTAARLGLGQPAKGLPPPRAAPTQPTPSATDGGDGNGGGWSGRAERRFQFTGPSVYAAYDDWGTASNGRRRPSAFGGASAAFLGKQYACWAAESCSVDPTFTELFCAPYDDAHAVLGDATGTRVGA